MQKKTKKPIKSRAKRPQIEIQANALRAWIHAEAARAAFDLLCKKTNYEITPALAKIGAHAKKAANHAHYIEEWLATRLVGDTPVEKRFRDSQTNVQGAAQCAEIAIRLALKFATTVIKSKKTGE